MKTATISKQSDLRISSLSPDPPFENVCLVPVVLRLAIVLSGLALLASCGAEPQVARENQKLISALRTAASARQTAWLDECAQQVEAGKKAGTISAAEAAAFDEIIALARAGKWKEAEQRAAALAAAQQPSPADVERLKTPAGRSPGG